MERKNLLDLLVSNHLTLSAMESVTGGLFASSFVSIPGASKAFKGSAVTYCDESKKAFGVPEDILEKHGAISAECAKSMALAASRFFGSDVSISFTGNAGPDADEGKPVGLVFVALKVKDTLYSFRLELTGDRETIRRQLVDFAFQTIEKKVPESL